MSELSNEQIEEVVTRSCEVSGSVLLLGIENSWESVLRALAEEVLEHRRVQGNRCSARLANGSICGKKSRRMWCSVACKKREYRRRVLRKLRLETGKVTG